MAPQCFAIAVLIISLSLGFAMKKRNKSALCALPLALLPLTNAVTVYIFRVIMHIQTPREILTAAIAVSAVLSLVLSSICSSRLFRPGKIKFAYIGIAVAFNIVLAWILLK